MRLLTNDPKWTLTYFYISYQGAIKNVKFQTIEPFCYLESAAQYTNKTLMRIWQLEIEKPNSSHYVLKGQLNSEWIYEVIVSSKIATKNYRDFCPGSLLEGRAKISVIFGCDFGRNDDLINSFWI